MRRVEEEVRRVVQRRWNQTPEGFIHGEGGWVVTRSLGDNEIGWVQGNAVQNEDTGAARTQGAVIPLQASQSAASSRDTIPDPLDT